MAKTKFGIIGAGKVGTTLAQHLQSHGILKWIYARSGRSEELVKKNCDQETNIIRNIDETGDLPNAIIISVNDQSIKDVDAFLYERFKNFENINVFHTSGVLPKDVLNAVRSAGAKVAAMHPFQTFFVQDASILRDIAWGIDCEPEDEEIFLEIALQLNGKGVILNDKAKKLKSLYHTTAVSASNYITTLIYLASGMAKEIDLDPNDLIPRIIETTVKNNLRAIGENNSGPALTGPIARGDSHTIRMHIESMEDKPELLVPYSLFGLATLEMAGNENLLEKEKQKELKALFLKGAGLKEESS